MVWLVVLLSAAAAALGALAWQQHTELLDLRARIGDDLARTTGDDQDAIVIVVRNHDEVAARRSRLAKGLSRISPAFVRNLVHREVLTETRRLLALEGVEADVRLRRVVSAPRRPDDPTPAPEAELDPVGS